MQQIYGIKWFMDIATKWGDNVQASYKNNCFENIYQLTKKLLKIGSDIIFVNFLLEYQFNSIVQYYRNMTTQKPEYIKKS